MSIENSSFCSIFVKINLQFIKREKTKFGNIINARRTRRNSLKTILHLLMKTNIIFLGIETVMTFPKLKKCTF